MIIQFLVQASLAGAFFVPWTTSHLQLSQPIRAQLSLMTGVPLRFRSSRHPKKFHHHIATFEDNPRYTQVPYVITHSAFTGLDHSSPQPNVNLTKDLAESRKYWFPLFSIIRFENGRCTGPAGQQGVCGSLRDCLRRGGSAFRSCAAGHGVCCFLSVSCGSTVVANNSYFASPSYQGGETQPIGSSCSLTINRAPGACQMPHGSYVCIIEKVRLDFIDFDLTSSDVGSCLNESFTVREQNINSKVPVICGKNNGQHMYIDVDMTPGPLRLDVRTQAMRNARWNIRITQVPCSRRAPANCLQYYTGLHGNFSSFNYYNAEGIPSQQGYMNNLDYTICIRRDAGYCSTAFFVNDLSPFVIQNVNPDSTPTTLETEAGLGVTECPQDYLLIGGARYCGTRLNPDMGTTNPRENAPVVDASSGPVSVRFVSDQTLNARGFEMNYRQNPC
ncbi:hypothetical protein BIW11_10532 [Tropilaelaps mercedesae]|uniref:CUB domain-containing protein n=1 Tax=Tropilaelaps mercedesae TaxID=418985 RepID=A0A1V9XFR6_9ACAR|nr:hypothetical protein BIW11_10532 [Tropilaelaps mercedesae]